MRCDARLLCSGACDSAARTAPVGGPALDRPSEPPTTPNEAAAAAAAAMTVLAERVPGRFIEEVQVLRVDGHTDLVAELECHVRRERRDEVGAGADDGLLGLACEHLLFG